MRLSLSPKIIRVIFDLPALRDVLVPVQGIHASAPVPNI